jgi:two-component system, NtrC family, sensor kinase
MVKPHHGKIEESIVFSNQNAEKPHFNLSHMEKMAAIGQLSSSVAHEMRNLMGMIRTATFNINRALQTSDPTVTNNLEVITRSVNRAREYIDNLLNLSRMPNGQEKEETIDVCQLVDNLLTLFYKELEWRNIRLERNYQPLPLLRLDFNALQECILNLILNSIQSMDNSGTITITIKPWKKGFHVSVSDTGCGIKATDLEKIFDHFYTTKKIGQGTGLGLSIARSLARDLGGDIRVESQPGRGSTFTIEVPDFASAVS